MWVVQFKNTAPLGNATSAILDTIVRLVSKHIGSRNQWLENKVDAVIPSLRNHGPLLSLYYYFEQIRLPFGVLSANSILGMTKRNISGTPIKTISDTVQTFVPNSNKLNYYTNYIRLY